MNSAVMPARRAGLLSVSQPVRNCSISAVSAASVAFSLTSGMRITVLRGQAGPRCGFYRWRWLCSGGLRWWWCGAPRRRFRRRRTLRKQLSSQITVAVLPRRSSQHEHSAGRPSARPGRRTPPGCTWPRARRAGAARNRARRAPRGRERRSARDGAGEGAPQASVVASKTAISTSSSPTSHIAMRPPTAPPAIACDCAAGRVPLPAGSRAKRYLSTASRARPVVARARSGQARRQTRVTGKKKRLGFGGSPPVGRRQQNGSTR